MSSLGTAINLQSYATSAVWFNGDILGLYGDGIQSPNEGEFFIESPNDGGGNIQSPNDPVS